MSLTVQQVNADSTFLITFNPPFAPPISKRKFPGSFTILLDPWLSGPSVVAHPKFATTNHATPSTLTSLSELDFKEAVDLIVISQDKSDHCHKETICSLPKNTKAKIFAPPKAVKEIRKWGHFEHPEIIQEIPTYNAIKPTTIIRIPIEAYSSASAEGELTITNITDKRDLTHLHNAIGITYCPPGTLLTAQDGSSVNLHDMPMMSTQHPTAGPRSRTSTTASLHTTHSPRRHYYAGSLDDISSIKASLPPPPTTSYETLPTFPRPNSRADSFLRRPSTSGSRPPTATNHSVRQQNYESVLSTLYTPHGIESGVLHSYVRNHLAPLNNALPVTALFHCINAEANPWFMGGTICTGAPGGVKLLKGLDVKYWVGAHDEVKESKGVAVRFITSKKYALEEVEGMLRKELAYEEGEEGTRVVTMTVGETRTLVA